MGILHIDCRRCGREMAVDDQLPLPPDFPFCSERCRMIDLGAWFEESYRVSSEVPPDLDTAGDDADFG